MRDSTEKPSTWDLIKLGRFEEACVRADADFQESKDVGSLRNKIFALLRLESVQEAIRLSEEIIRLTDGRADHDFIFLGVAHWLNGESEKAIAKWVETKKTKYTDAAGGVEIPMLLLFAATRTGDTKLDQKARRMLAKLIKSKAVVNWPGPIAQYLLGSISEDDLKSQIDAQPILHENQACQADFYIGVKRLFLNDTENFRASMKACLSHGLVCAAKAEPYLAQSELNQLVRR